MKIVIDPGHDQTTPGKRSPEVPPGIREYLFNRNVAWHCSEKFKSFGFETVSTVSGDNSVKVPLVKRRATEGDLFLSIHANALGNGGWRNEPKERGAIVFCNEQGYSIAKKLIDVYRAMIPEIPRRRSGYEINKSLYVLRNQKRPALLVECGFMTHHEEASFLALPSTQYKIGTAIALGILDGLE